MVQLHQATMIADIADDGRAVGALWPITDLICFRIRSLRRQLGGKRKGRPDAAQPQHFGISSGRHSQMTNSL